MATEQEEWEKWFQSVWAEREDKVYRQLFGDIGQQIHTIPPVLFERMGFKEVDPRWLVHGVFESPPSDLRRTWLYVTSAMSNPWGEDPATVNPRLQSGLGFELLLQTPEQAPWAIQVLHWLMAVQILAASGMVQGDTVQVHDRVPLHTSIDPNMDSAVRHLLICEPEVFPTQFKLASGTVELLLCIGITDEENVYAREYGAKPLLTKLHAGGVFPLTDATRGSVDLD
jgi:hypothetical protein